MKIIICLTIILILCCQSVGAGEQYIVSIQEADRIYHKACTFNDDKSTLTALESFYTLRLIGYGKHYKDGNYRKKIQDFIQKSIDYHEATLINYCGTRGFNLKKASYRPRRPNTGEWWVAAATAHKKEDTLTALEYLYALLNIGSIRYEIQDKKVIPDLEKWLFEAIKYHENKLREKCSSKEYVVTERKSLLGGGQMGR